MKFRKNGKPVVITTQRQRQNYEKMFKRQHGRCAICGDKQNDQRLARDHNHITKEPRALLCRRCNSGLGFFRENPQILREAAFYLEEWA